MGAKPRQGDLFEQQCDDDLAEDHPTPVYCADPDKVRAELLLILAEASTATEMPWDPDQLRLYRTIFPQMTNWLPTDEATQLNADFEAELTRLTSA
jgi:hypothetical protein